MDTSGHAKIMNQWRQDTSLDKLLCLGCGACLEVKKKEKMSAPIQHQASVHPHQHCLLLTYSDIRHDPGGLVLKCIMARQFRVLSRQTQFDHFEDSTSAAGKILPFHALPEDPESRSCLERQ